MMEMEQEIVDEIEAQDNTVLDGIIKELDAVSQLSIVPSEDEDVVQSHQTDRTYERAMNELCNNYNSERAIESHSGQKLVPSALEKQDGQVKKESG